MPLHKSGYFLDKLIKLLDNERMNSKTKHGGLRPNSGRKKGVIKGRQIIKQIQVNITVFAELDLLKKQQKSKTWNTFFIDNLGLKSANLIKLLDKS